MVGVLFNLSLSAIEKPIQIIRRYSLNLLTKFLSNTLILQMSHPVNDEILERLYEEVKEEFPNALEPFVIAEVQKRFEEMS